MDRRLDMVRTDRRLVRMATMTTLRMPAPRTDTMARIGLTVGSSLAPDRGFAVGFMAAELDMDTAAGMATVVRATQLDAADMATQRVADMPVALVGTSAAENEAAIVAAGQQSAAADFAAAVAEEDSAAAVVAVAGAVVADTGKA
jgi:hypothetical protein